jgi:uncharacterized protein YbjT (DUF2867 family)
MPPATDPAVAEANRLALHTLLRDNGLSQAGAAAIITELSGRPCSLRSIMSWLAAPSASSARPCPTWAVDIIREALEKHHPSIAQAKRAPAGKRAVLKME